MKILFDTHTFLWYLEGKETEKTETKEQIQDITNTLYFSAVSYWEICIKISIGKLRLQSKWKEKIDHVLVQNQITWLDIKKGHMLGIIDLPWYHKDPFDRLLVAQAKAENCVFYSADGEMKKYGITLL